MGWNGGKGDGWVVSRVTFNDAFGAEPNLEWQSRGPIGEGLTRAPGSRRSAIRSW